MVKIKSKTKDCHLIIRAKLTRGNKINENELQLFAREYLCGFLRPREIKQNVLEYMGPVAVPISERLSKPITKYDFFFLIEQIVDATYKLQQKSFLWNKVLWNINNAYINETTREVQFIYLPLDSEMQFSNILGFMETIIYSAKAEKTQDADAISRFAYFLKSLPQYDPDRIEGYIMREDRSIVNIIKKHGSRFIADKPKDDYDLYRQGQSSDDEATGLLVDEANAGFIKDEGTAMLQDDEATGLLIDVGGEETALLVQDNIHYPTLYRVLTEETIPINKPVFRLGKERSYVDYFVTNNNAVSRGHADIITRGQKYFVIDRNSKNKTYINGQAIPPQCECEILDGSRLVLGNEEFLFNA